MEQLQRYDSCEKSSSASNLTAPQWQLPLYVFSIGGNGDVELGGTAAVLLSR
jgi:hypothetical protein